MIVLLAVALIFIAWWTVIELTGAFDGTQDEDTFSEWVWDLPLWSVLLISAVQIIIGYAAIASTWHYLEGWARRRRRERQ